MESGVFSRALFKDLSHNPPSCDWTKLLNPSTPRAIERTSSDVEIQQAGAQPTIIEDYPDDNYAPSSLLLGFTVTGRPIHIQASHADSALLKIMPIYEPDPAERYEYARRRS